MIKAKDVRAKLRSTLSRKSSQEGVLSRAGKLFSSKSFKFVRFGTFPDINAFNFVDGSGDEQKLFMLVFSRQLDRGSIDYSTSSSSSATPIAPLAKDTKILCQVS